jgi:hypothetical protein
LHRLHRAKQYWSYLHSSTPPLPYVHSSRVQESKSLGHAGRTPPRISVRLLLCTVLYPLHLERHKKRYSETRARLFERADSSRITLFHAYSLVLLPGQHTESENPAHTPAHTPAQTRRKAAPKPFSVQARDSRELVPEPSFVPTLPIRGVLQVLLAPFPTIFTDLKLLVSHARRLYSSLSLAYQATGVGSSHADKQSTSSGTDRNRLPAACFLCLCQPLAVWELSVRHLKLLVHPPTILSWLLLRQPRLSSTSRLQV